MSGLEDDAWNPRGWSVRHGCRRRLEKPKRGRAAIVAEIQGQGKDVLRGRSAFKRSKNTGSDYGKSVDCYSPALYGKYGCDFLSQLRRKKLRKATLQDGWEALETLEEDQSSVTLEEELDEEELFEEPWQFLSEADADWPDDCASSTESTEASAQDPPSRVCTLFVEHSDSGKEACKPSRWDLALIQAKVAASVYDLHLKGNGPPMLDSPVVVKRKRKLHLRTRTGKPNTLEGQLLKFYNTHLVCSTRSSIGIRNSSRTRRKTEKLEAETASETATNFEQFCRRFIDEHGKQVCQGLQRCFQGPVMLQIAPLGVMVQQRFMDACSGPLEGTLRPTFHGTGSWNLESIYKHGLMVPGHGNTLRVANGSAHGVGIYTANVRNPWLSWDVVEKRCWFAESSTIQSVMGHLRVGTRAWWGNPMTFDMPVMQ